MATEYLIRKKEILILMETEIQTTWMRIVMAMDCLTQKKVISIQTEMVILIMWILIVTETVFQMQRKIQAQKQIVMATVFQIT